MFLVLVGWGCSPDGRDRDRPRGPAAVGTPDPANSSDDEAADDAGGPTDTDDLPDDTDAPVVDPPSGPYDPFCDLGLEDVFPADGAWDVYYRTTVEYTFENAPGGDELIELTEVASGAAVPGSMAYRNHRVVFTPDAPLTPETTYEATLANCPPSQVAWTTNSTGKAVDLQGMVGTTYVVELADGRWLQPPGVGLLLAALMTQELLLGVLDVSADDIQMIGALSIPGGLAQDMCAESIDFPLAAFDENPYFSLGPDDTVVNILGSDVEIRELTVTGAFRPDLIGIDGAVFRGMIDTRQVVDLLVPGGGEDAVCELMGGFGVDCVPCGNGGAVSCLRLFVDNLPAPRGPGPLVPRGADEIAADPMCP